MKQAFIRWGSILITIASIIYFVYYARSAIAGVDLSKLLSARMLAGVAALTALYAMLIPTTALAWTLLLRALKQKARYRQTLAILATTQFGKYLPGNVAQHIGRVVMARAAGIELTSALFSMAYETLLVLLACAHISALTLLWAPPEFFTRWQIVDYRTPLLIAVTAGTIAFILLAPHLAATLSIRREKSRGNVSFVPQALHLRPVTALRCYAVYLVNFFIVGVGLWVLVRAMPSADASAPGLLFLTGAFSISWILGFVTPGAPAGLGVREVVLGAWLSESMPPAQIVLAIVALRIATTLGDLLNFVAGGIATRRMRRIGSN